MLEGSTLSDKGCPCRAVELEVTDWVGDLFGKWSKSITSFTTIYR